MAKTYDEKIAELQRKQAQLREQEKKLKARQSEAARKARTRRLIQIGGAVESVLGRPMDEKEIPTFVSFLKREGNFGSYFLNAMKERRESSDIWDDIDLSEEENNGLI